MAGKESKKTPATDKALTFEEALSRLESIAVTQYEEGMKLIRRCRSILSDAEAKIQQLQLADDGSLTPTPMELPPAE